jgi:hypothetical protein
MRTGPSASSAHCRSASALDIFKSLAIGNFSCLAVAASKQPAIAKTGQIEHDALVGGQLPRLRRRAIARDVYRAGTNAVSRGEQLRTDITEIKTRAQANGDIDALADQIEVRVGEEQLKRQGRVARPEIGQ